MVNTQIPQNWATMHYNVSTVIYVAICLDVIKTNS